MTSKQRLGVIVVDPLPVVRAALALMIDDRPDMEVLAEAGTAEEALEAVRRIRGSHVSVLISLGLEGEHDSYWLIRTIRDRFPGVSVLACGANADPLSISRALFSGADGFLDKSSDHVEFLQSLRRGSTGEMVLAGPPTEWGATFRRQTSRQSPWGRRSVTLSWATWTLTDATTSSRPPAAASRSTTARCGRPRGRSPRAASPSR